MKNKKIWTKVMAAILCASLVFPVSAYAAETNGDSQIEAQAEEPAIAEEPAAAEDARPTVGETIMEPTEQYKDFKATITAGSGKYKASKVKVEMANPKTGLVVSAFPQNDDPGFVVINDEVLENGLSLAFMFEEYGITTGKAGDYPVRVIFCDENGNEIDSNETSVKLRMNEDWSMAENSSNTELKWDGVSDLVYKFNPGYGLGAAGRWQEDENTWGSCAKEMRIHAGQGIDYTIYNGKDYVLDLNGSVTIKGSALKRIANENKDFGSAECYYLDLMCMLKSESQPVILSFTFTYDRNASNSGTSTTPVKEVTLPAENTSVPANEMTSIVEQNKEADVVIHNPNGVDFTFAKGTMKLINGKEAYDFGTTLITDAKDKGITGVSADEFAFRLNFNYSGELPGTAKISIDLGKDSKWIGKTLYYSLIESGKIKKQIYKNVVDKNGVYTVEQNHCSDYVATTKDMAPQENGQVPKTGDTSFVFLLMALMFVSGAIVFGTWGAKRRLK